MKMKYLYLKFKLILVVIITVVFFSGCKKEGCTDNNALNYSIASKKDDGTCVFPKQLRIKSIELKLLSASNENGVEWDEDGLPDCFFKIYNENTGLIYTTEIKSVDSLHKAIVYNIEPNIILPIDSIGTDFNMLRFVLEDDDMLFSNTMTECGYYLNSIPYHANSLHDDFDSFVKRLKLIAYENVSIILVREWE